VVLRSLNNSIVLLDKPAGRTSFDVINDLKRFAGVKKIGHSGTLDKFASGLLVVCTGKFTRLTRYFLESDKRYTGTIQLGIETDTYDITGEIISQKSFSGITESDIKEGAARFTGSLSQNPPRYSSLKVRGKRASDRMRRGEDVILAPRNVKIHHFIITGIDFDKGLIDFDIKCSKGTYIRSLARDLGEELGTAACLSALRRLESGTFNLADAIPPEGIGEYMKGESGSAFLIDPVDALKDFGRIILDSAGSVRVKNGAFFSRENVLEMQIDPGNKTLIIDVDENLIAIADIDVADWLISYDSVFN